jgi:hypothetical protein
VSVPKYMRKALEEAEAEVTWLKAKLEESRSAMDTWRARALLAEGFIEGIRPRCSEFSVLELSAMHALKRYEDWKP